jgi:hypothetical protein
MEICFDGKLRGPTLPKDLDWCERTKKWWLTWRKSPQAQLMGESDWESMLEAALIHNYIWSNHPSMFKPSELAGLTKELHRILANFGLTYADRLKLRIKLSDEVPNLDETPDEVPSNVVSMYRNMVS